MPKQKRLSAADKIAAALRKALVPAAPTIKQSGSKKLATMAVPFTVPKWALGSRPANLYSTTAAGVVLTGQGRLLLSQAVLPGGRGVRSEKLLPFANNEFEWEVASALCKVKPELLIPCRDPLQGLFLFFCYYIPLFCRITVHQQHTCARDIPLWLWEHSTYLLAYERLCLEGYWRWRRKQRPKNDAGPARVEGSAKAPKKSFAGWFCSQGYLYWLKRFRSWRGAALKSFHYYMRKNSRKVTDPDPQIRRAALFGALKRFSELPGGVFGQELKTLLALPSTQRVFQRSRGRKSVLRGLVLNTWLIESWPVVTEYEWTYHDVQKAAAQKFESYAMSENLISSETSPKAVGPSEDESPLDTAKRIEDRCKSLGLRLSSGGRAKAGKPLVTEVAPPFCTLTCAIDGIAHDPAKWVGGQLDIPA